ncbi:MAG: SpoIIE family protein phosphatase [Acidimicrobiales bacterium]
MPVPRGSDPPSIVYGRLARLQRVSARLTAARTTDDVVAVVLDELADAVGAAATTLSLREPDGRTVRVAGARGFDDDVVARWSRFDVEDPAPMAHTIRTGEPLLLQSRDEVLARFPELEQELLVSRRQALVTLPLEADGVVFGAIGIGFAEERTFDEDEARFLDTLARQCSVAYDRSRAYEAEAQARTSTEATRTRLMFLSEASTVLASSLDWEQTLARVADLAVPRLADWCAVYLEADGRIEAVKVAHVDPEKREAMASLQRHHRPSLDSELGVGAVIRTGSSVLVSEIDDNILVASATNPDHLEDMRALGATSAVIVPLSAEGRTMGALALVTTDERRLDEDDLLLAKELATRVSQAIANATLYRERAHVARTLQASLLPPTAPKIPGLEVASRFVAGGDGVMVGGDFYDVFPAGEPDLGAWHIVIGDVRGKGVDAAALTGVARSTVRSAAINEPSPAQILSHLNEVLVRNHLDEGAGGDGDPRFCTMVVGTVTTLPNGICVELAVAGHPLPFLLKADGSTEQVGIAGTLLGVVPDPILIDSRVELAAGDALVLYTDGITERHADDRFFEEDGLAQVLARCAGFTAATLAERIETAARAFVEDEPRDDLAILVVRVPERPASTTSASTDLPPHPLSARRARRFVLTALDAFAVRGLDEVAELLTSEVVTNAVVHAHSSVRVSVEGVDGGVRISVADTNPLIPAPRQPVDEAEHGRGLHLVDTLAARWGVEPGDAGKSVWFELWVEQRSDP